MMVPDDGNHRIRKIHSAEDLCAYDRMDLHLFNLRRRQWTRLVQDVRRDGEFADVMKQRACLAKTLLHDPKVLILDEPASGLDPRARIELRELLREMQRMGKTILISSHILTELSTMCTTVGIIEAGKLVAAGRVEDILKRVRAHREFLVDLLREADAERASKTLEGAAGVREVKASGKLLRLVLAATEAEIAAIPALLAARDLPFIAFREDLADLETAFLTLTRGALA